MTNGKLYIEYLKSAEVPVPVSPVTATFGTVSGGGLDGQVTITDSRTPLQGGPQSRTVPLLELMNFAYTNSINVVGECFNQLPERFVSVPKQ